MYIDGMNIYQRARQSAGLTQERAAELLDFSVESVKAYETGIRIPPAPRVMAMAEVYRTPWLRLEHARETDELGLIPEAAQAKPFPIAAMQFYNYLLDFAEKHRGRQLLKIAEDGVIDEDERPLYDEIVCEIEGITAALLSLLCAQEQKKDRPDVGASKRSSSRSKMVKSPETIDKIIIPQCRGNASKTCAGKAVQA